MYNKLQKNSWYGWKKIVQNVNNFEINLYVPCWLFCSALCFINFLSADEVSHLNTSCDFTIDQRKNCKPINVLIENKHKSARQCLCTFLELHIAQYTRIVQCNIYKYGYKKAETFLAHFSVKSQSGSYRIEFIVV